jgi:exopolysaccharide biosynthesis polyprenyl glycosylphosphotransferase
VILLQVLIVVGAFVGAFLTANYFFLAPNAQAAAVCAVPQRRTLSRHRILGPRLDRLLVAGRAPEHVEGRLDLGRLDSRALRESPLVRQTICGAKVKRCFDIGLSGLLILFAGPVLIAAAAAIKLDSPGPVLFRQTRVGHAGKLFSVLKLRTMTVDAEAEGAVWARSRDKRVTRVGAFLRRTRIDEIPQAFNVFYGSMSFVGPRPERPEFTGLLAEAIPHYGERHLVKPGLTGWAQVNYPYGASVKDAAEKLRYDLYYVKNFSLLLDAFIVIKTLKVALSGDGAR